MLGEGARDDGRNTPMRERRGHWPASRSKPAEWTLETLVEGTTASFEQRITTADIDAFADLSGDDNPVHMDPSFAQAHGFRSRVAHGAFLAALASRLIGTLLPGRNALLLSLRLEFPAATFPDDILEVAGTVATIHPGARTVALRLTMRCGPEVRARGTALVMVQRESSG